MATPVKVLCVDDNVDAADTTADILRLNGFAVCACHDGPSALVTAQDFRPDVCLLDLSMPGMDGFSLARELRQTVLGPDARMIALTALWDVTMTHRTNNAGFEAHLVKPADPARLIAAVHGRTHTPACNTSGFGIGSA